MKMSLVNREESFLVKASLIVNGIEINEVPCKIFLPERIYDKPYVEFKPTKSDGFKIIMGSYQGKFKACILTADGKVHTSIESPEVYFSGAFTKYWGKDISESTIPGEPQDLHVIKHFERSDEEDKTQLNFWISPNKLLSPAMIQTTSYKGEIYYERINNLEFTIKDNVRLTFDKHFKSKKDVNGDLVQWSYLVACVKLDVPAIEVEELKKYILQDIDDFLLIASLALRKRTACLGWNASDKNSLTTYYRGNYTFPDCVDKSNSSDELAEIQSFESFMNTCFNNFLVFENKLSLRNALCSAVPLKPLTVETSFLHLFAGLETLVLDFKRRQKLEFILDKSEWQQLKNSMEKCVKQSINPKLDSEQRKSIYNKLGELNRISLREAFDIFCKQYAIYSSDLWPVFGEKGCAGLAEIRNRLIHGDPFPHEYIGALVLANEHLQYTLERMLVRVLGWDVSKTMVNPTYLEKNSPSIKQLSFERERLSKYINT